MQCIQSTKSYTIFTPPTVFSTLLSNDSTANSSNSFSTRETFDYYQESKDTVQCVWRRSELTAWEFSIYAFIVPVLAFFGFCANFINFIVFMRPKMTPSAFSYLAVLSWLDCISCLLITLTCFSRSFLYNSTFWLSYDFQWQTPLFGTTTGAANLILACVSLDRFLYLRWGIPNGTPKFCTRVVARRMIMAVVLFSILINLPYFLVFVVNDDGTFETTDFYFSRYYQIHNWFAFSLLTLLPAIFLMIGNAAILIAFCKWTKQSKKCRKSCPNGHKNTENRYKHQMKLTVTIVIVVTLYLIGELPAHLTSRKSVVNLLYGGDIKRINFQSMQRLEVICITLNAIQLSMNIIVYAVINPCFLPEFFGCLKGASDVCFRFMGFMALAKCWRKMCNSSERRNKHKKSECVDADHHRQEQRSCDISWQENDTSESTQNVIGNSKIINQEKQLNISVVCSANYKQSFDNPTFSSELK